MQATTVYTAEQLAELARSAGYTHVRHPAERDDVSLDMWQPWGKTLAKSCATFNGANEVFTGLEAYEIHPETGELLGVLLFTRGQGA